MTVTELVSARGICYDENFTRNHRFLDLGEGEYPVLIQLFGADPEDMAKAVERVLSHPLYGRCAGIDINMGCPVDKVVKTGAGAALMKTPDLAARLTEAAVKAARPFGKPVSAKFRSGWDEDHINAPDFARRLEDAGAAFLCLHARTRRQMYAGKADRMIFRETTAGLSVPLIANGDAGEPEDALRLLNELGAEALMIGRAAVGDPWIFARLSGGTEDGRTNPVIWSELVKEHLLGLCRSLGEYTGIREFRPALSAYIKGKPGAAALRRELMQITELSELLQLIDKTAEQEYPEHKTDAFSS